MVQNAIIAKELLKKINIDCYYSKCCFVKPIDKELIKELVINMDMI